MEAAIGVIFWLFVVPFVACFFLEWLDKPPWRGGK